MEIHNKVIQWILIGLLILLLGSCRQNTTYGLGKVKTKIKCSGGSCDSTLYVYDSQNRISIISNTANGIQRYSYNGQTISIYNGSSVSAVYAVNSAGLVASVNTQSYGDSFAYNNYGNLIYVYQYAPPAYTNNVISNGNTVISYRYQPIAYSGGGYDTTYSTFLSDTDNRDYGMSFLGKSNLNLINTDSSLSSTYEYGQTLYTTNVNNYIYTFDGQHRVATEIVRGSNVTTSYSFTYY